MTEEKKGIGVGTNPMDPVSFKVEFQGQTVELNLHYNSYGMDIMRSASKAFGISDKDARKLKIVTPSGEELIKAARLFDFVGPFYAGCTLTLEEK